MGFFCGFESPCNKRHSVRLLLQNKKPGLAAARSDVNDWRRGETNHRAADFPAKKKCVRINEHWLQLPVGLIEDWEVLRDEDRVEATWVDYALGYSRSVCSSSVA